MNKKIIITSNLIIFIFILFIACSGQNELLELVIKGNTVPNLELLTYTGKKYLLYDHIKDTNTVLYLWGYFAPPCRIEIEHLTKLAYKYRHKNLKILAVSVFPSLPEEVKKYTAANPEIKANQIKTKIKNFIKANNKRIDFLYATPKVLRQFGNPVSIPHTYFINSKGILIKKYTSAKELWNYETGIIELLTEEDEN